VIEIDGQQVMVLDENKVRTIRQYFVRGVNFLQMIASAYDRELANHQMIDIFLAA